MNKIFTYTFTKKLCLLGLLTLLSFAHVFAQAPVISSFSPASGPVGTTVTITGTGFAPAAANNVVFFGATMATVTSASATSLTVTVPVGSTYEPISVLNGTTALIGYSAKPFITTFTPTKGNITADDLTPPIAFSTGHNCTGIAIADIDGDGKPDLVLANTTGTALSVLRNTSISGSITSASFAPKVDFAAAGATYQIAVGDLDGDGKPDVVVSCSGTQPNIVAVFRNTSTIGFVSFASRVDFTDVNEPLGIAIADLDGDGKPEIAVAEKTSAGVAIWPNISSPGTLTSSSFGAKIELPSVVGSQVSDRTSIAIADLDGDGKSDIVVNNVQSNTISVYRNNTTGSLVNSIQPFDPNVEFFTGGNSNGDDPIVVKIGDIDGDGKPDLVASNYSPNQSSWISILRNTSTPGSINSSSFAPEVEIPCSHPWGIAIGDMDGDGKPDLAIVNGDDSQVSVFRNTSIPGSITATSFASAAKFAAGLRPEFIAMGDLDGDGKADIAVPGFTSGTATNNNVYVLRNNPVFPPDIQATNVVFTNTTANSTTVNWTNGNGPARAVFICNTATGIPASVGSTTYTANTVYGTGSQIGSSGWYCIYNGTGSTVDVTGLSSGATYRVMVVEYNGSVGAENYVATTSTGNPANVTTVAGGAIAINSISLVTSSPTNASQVQYNVVFAAPVTGLTTTNFALATTGSIASASIAAVNGSGTTYSVLVNTGVGNGTIGLNLSNANGISPGIITPLPFVGSVYTIDRTQPGALPPVITSFNPATGPAGTSVTITGTGFGSTLAGNIVFFGATMATVTAASATSLTVTVPEGTTYMPISVLNSNTALIGYSAKPFIATFTPHKDAITHDDFMPRVTFNTGGGCTAIAIVDLDGDGKPDLVALNQYSQSISVFQNTSVNGSITSGSFAPKVDFSTGVNGGRLRMAIGDLDGDGKPDIVVAGGATVSIFRNASTIGSITSNSFAPRVDLDDSNSAIDVAIGDLDGDGKPDIVVSNLAGGSAMSYWRNISTVGSITTSSFEPRRDGGDKSSSPSHDFVAIADLDGDGIQDIVLADSDDMTVSILHDPGVLNQNHSSASFATGQNPINIAIGDLDGDGKPDLVVANRESNTVSVFRNTSTIGSFTNSSFAAKIDFATGYYPYDVVIGDLDGDGKPDLAVGNANDLVLHPDPNNNTISVLRNTSTIGTITANSFSPRVDFASGQTSNALMIGDLDGDGKPDIAVTNDIPGTTSATLSVFRNNPLFPPDIQASNVVFTNTAANSTTASWSNGDGTARAVFISMGTTGSPLPIQSTTYSANPFYAQGSQIGTSGWYCIYNGTGSSVDITGLSSGATYRVMVVEYNGYAGGENYQTAVAAGNPANVTTVAGGSIAINSISRVSPELTNASSIQYTATFATPVTGLTASDFALTTTASITGASIASVSGSGSTYTITVNTGTGDGTIGVNLINAGGLAPALITPLPFTGQIYTIDKTPPVITVSSPSDTTILSGSKAVTYSVKYSDVNFNSSTLSTSNITLNHTGSAMGAISVSGSDTTYTVTISNITGSGTLGISIAAGTASDIAGNTAPASGLSSTFIVKPLLSGLTISSGTLTPVFKSTVTNYTASVTSQTSTITVTPVTNDPNATVTLNGGNVSAPVNLVLGFNYIHVKATTLDGNITTDYTLVVYRPAPSVPVLAPNIAYQPVAVKVTGTIPFSIKLKNTGGAVPGQVYGQVTTLSGDTSALAGATGYVDGLAKSALFNNPQDMAFDASNNLYITDAANNVIRKITPAGVVSTFAGSTSAVPGSNDGRDTSARFNFPDGLVFDPLGNLFVADYYNAAIRKITADGTVSTFYQSTPDVFDPTGICFDRAGNLVVSLQTSARIVSISPTGVLSTIAGTDHNYGWTDGPGAQATFIGPTDVKMDTLGNLLIPDGGANELRKITPDHVVSTLAGNYGNLVYKLNGVGQDVSFTVPTGIQIMPNGTMYLTDLENNDIRKVLPDGTVSLFSGYVPVYPPGNPSAGWPTQQPGYVNGKIAVAQYYQPCYIRADNIGDLYVSEWGGGGNRIRKITITGYTFSGPALPAGLTFDITTGKISGTVTTPFATQTDTVTAYNISGSSTAIITLSYQPPSTIATLSNLVPSAGILTPVFASATTNYTVSVPNATASINVTPTATDSTATIKVNGIAVVSGTASGSIPLVVGPNAITIVVTAQDSVTTDTYTVIVNRAALSTVATLNDLTISNGTLTPSFTTGTVNYAASVANNVSSITVTPTTTDSTATITVNGMAVASGTASAAIPLAVGPNTITTVVTAQDGITTDTYTLVVTRLLGSDATLANLTLSSGTLNPTFASGIVSYTAGVTNATTSLTLTPITNDNNATVTVNGIGVTSGTASAAIPLAVGPNTITTVVTAQDGTTTDTYTVVVTRAPSSVATLDNLTVSQGTLSPAFASGTTSYTDAVPNTTTSITVTPTFTDNAATITVNGTVVASGTASAAIPLAVGPNTITTVVTAQDGTTTDTYTVVVTRAPSSVATLDNLTVSQGILSPVFASGTTNYTDAVANAVTGITVTPTFTDNTATITVNGTTVTSGTASAAFPLAVGPNMITTVVTAQDGTTMGTYTVVVTRAADSDATLTNLIVSQGTLTPTFSSGTFAYADNVPNSTTSIAVTPTVSDPNATIKVNGVTVASGTPSASIPLNVGTNTITAVVTAQDGTTTNTYTVVVTRAPSADAGLVNLTVSEGTLSPSFSSGTTAYKDTVSNLISSLTVTMTTSDQNATITVNGTAVASGSPSGAIPLMAGENTITVIITAQDGTTTNTYTITVYRGESMSSIETTNVLTPNGDGKNDYWLIKDIQLYPQNNVTVYDKAGRVVYAKRGYSNDWDGTLNGRPLAEGTYYFVVDLGPNLRKFKGYVSILRN